MNRAMHVALRALPVVFALASGLAAMATLRGARGEGGRPSVSTRDSGQESVGRAEPPPASPLPLRLSETGLYAAGSTTEVAAGVVAFSPQYPLWSDGAVKRRWLRLPPGARIDAANPAAWVFPIGTRFWKEFGFGTRTETRTIERLADGSFRFATYVWNADQSDALLAPERGVRAAKPIRGGVQHDIPGVDDCRACHEGRRSQILGFSALQLSSERDPLAANAELPLPGAVDLAELIRRGWLANFPETWRTEPPRIEAPTALARAAAGYFLGNCAHCHNAEGPLAGLGLDLDSPVGDAESYARLSASVVGRASRFRLPRAERSERVVAKRPDQSALWFRMGSREPTRAMPPLGSKVVDPRGLELVRRWILSDPVASLTNKEIKP